MFLNGKPPKMLNISTTTICPDKQIDTSFASQGKDPHPFTSEYTKIQNIILVFLLKTSPFNIVFY